MRTGKVKEGTVLILKICTKCKKEENHTSKGKLCVTCVSKNSAKYMVLNKEHRKGYYKKWRGENIDGLREAKKKQYQLIKDTPEYKQKVKDNKKKPKHK